jgi:DNA/RNA-binding domain of Phe-tRNA-synthetase-like protein
MTDTSSLRLSVAPHPLLRPVAFETTFSKPLGEFPTPPSVMDLLSMDARGPITRSEEVRMAVRDLLRHWGHKPAGRGKPAAEYLVRAIDRGELTSINLAVDVCNVISFHSGFSIALVDLELARPPFRVDRGPEDGTYIFNPSGQEMSLKGLICLFDGHGPCGNPVKDAQRTKTHAWTTRTLTVIWGVEGFPDQLRGAFEWYRALLVENGASVLPVPVESEGEGTLSHE